MQTFLARLQFVQGGISSPFSSTLLLGSPHSALKREAGCVQLKWPLAGSNGGHTAVCSFHRIMTNMSSLLFFLFGSLFEFVFLELFVVVVVVILFSWNFFPL